MSDAKRKGDLLENLVGLMHEELGVDVRVRVKLPVVSGTARTREIDVLLATVAAGYPVRIAIECKNWSEPVGIGDVGNFGDKLRDVGVQHGIMVAANAGYSSGALTRAAELGIRTLTFEGLTPDRIRRAVNDALMTIAYLLLSIDTYSILPFVPKDAAGEKLPHGVTVDPPHLNDWIWKAWLMGNVPEGLGEHVLTLRSASGSEVAVVDVNVTAHVAQLAGAASVLKLRDVSSDRVERVRVEPRFEIPNKLKLHSVRTDASLRSRAGITDPVSGVARV